MADVKQAVNGEEAQFLSVEEEWARMTPAQRFAESTGLWAVYLSLGGSLDPQPDSQSPEIEKDRDYWRRLRQEIEAWREGRLR